MAEAASPLCCAVLCCALLCCAARAERPLPALCSMFVGPLFIKFADTCPSAKYYVRRKMGPVGGSVCVGKGTTVNCTRFD